MGLPQLVAGERHYDSVKVINLTLPVFRALGWKEYISELVECSIEETENKRKRRCREGKKAVIRLSTGQGFTMCGNKE